MTPSETQRTLEIVAKCWRRFESIDNPHEGGRSFAQFLDDEIRREQEVDCSANHQCKACGRFQLFTFDQGWICPECSGRYAGKFPLNAAAPAPAETTARETVVMCKHPWHVMTRLPGHVCPQCGRFDAYSTIMVPGPQPVSEPLPMSSVDRVGLACIHGREQADCAICFVEWEKSQRTPVASPAAMARKPCLCKLDGRCAGGDAIGPGYYCVRQPGKPVSASARAAGGGSTVTISADETARDQQCTPQGKNAGPSPVPTPPDAAHIPPMKGLCRHDFAGTPNCIKCGADRFHWSAGGSNASTITDAAQGKPKLPQCPWCFWYVNHSPRCTRPDKESPTMELDTLADDADGDLDKDTYEQFQQNEDMPDDAEIVIRVGTVRKINKVFQHIDAARKERERPAPTTTGESGLRECPFCGGRAICASNLEAYQAGAAFDLLHWIFCVECRAQTVRFKDAQHASAAWNTRSTPRAMEGDAEVTRLRNILERDRSTVADGVNALKKAMASYDWLRGPGRGSYAFDDERYQKEFGDALDLIRAAIDPLLRVAGDWTDCPTSPADIAAARAGRRVGTEGLTVEALAAASEPDLFSADADVAHRAASPLNVAYARDAAREKARRTIVALTRHSTGGTE